MSMDPCAKLGQDLAPRIFHVATAVSLVSCIAGSVWAGMLDLRLGGGQEAGFRVTMRADALLALNVRRRGSY